MIHETIRDNPLAYGKFATALIAAWAFGVLIGINYVGSIAIPEPVYFEAVKWRSEAETMARNFGGVALLATLAWVALDYRLQQSEPED